MPIQEPMYRDSERLYNDPVPSSRLPYIIYQVCPRPNRRYNRMFSPPKSALSTMHSTLSKQSKSVRFTAEAPNEPSRPKDTYRRAHSKYAPGRYCCVDAEGCLDISHCTYFEYQLDQHKVLYCFRAPRMNSRQVSSRQVSKRKWATVLLSNAPLLPEEIW
jgi:hypothetical protein